MMQQFNDVKGRGRNFTILNMKAEEANSFYSQFQKWPQDLQQQCAEELKDQIQKGEEDFLQWILVVRANTEQNELIGKIEVVSFDEKEAAVRIQIPNTDLALKYGVEVVEEFLQICKDNHYFEIIELDNTFVAARYTSTRNFGFKMVNVA